MRLCLGKLNFIIMGISALMILVGFTMMVCEPSTSEAFNPEVFAPMHWEYAGTVCFLGYVLMIVGICVKGKRKPIIEEEPVNEVAAEEVEAEAEVVAEPEAE